MAYNRVLCLFYKLITPNTQMTQNTRETGNMGEDIACSYLEKQGFLIQERNYLKKWGEIDIIAVKDKILHFIEVKSVADRGGRLDYRPEENVHELKQRKLRKIIQTYLHDKKYGIDVQFEFHVITVKLNKMTGESEVKMLENLIL